MEKTVAKRHQKIKHIFIGNLIFFTIFFYLSFIKISFVPKFDWPIMERRWKNTQDEVWDRIIPWKPETSE